MFFKAGPDFLQSVFGSDRKYWSQQMKTALGLDGVSGFPYQLSPLKNKTALPIPVIDFTEKAPSIAEIYNIGNKYMPHQTSFYHIISRNIQTNQAQAHNIS